MEGAQRHTVVCAGTRIADGIRSAWRGTCCRETGWHPERRGPCRLWRLLLGPGVHRALGTGEWNSVGFKGGEWIGSDLSLWGPHGGPGGDSRKEGLCRAPG